MEEAVDRHGAVLGDHLVGENLALGAGQFVDQGRDQAVAVAGDPGQAFFKGCPDPLSGEIATEHDPVRIADLGCDLIVAAD